MQKPSPEEFMQEVMSSLPGPEYPVITTPAPSKKKPNKPGNTGGEYDPDGGDSKPPVICEPPVGDDLVLQNMLEEGEPARAIYARVLVEMADEDAHMKSLRVAAENMGIPFSKISRDRVSTLKELADIMDKKVKEETLKGGNTGGKVDFHSENFQNIVRWILEQTKAAAKDAMIPDHSVKLLFTRLQQSMNGFEEIAEGIYYGEASSVAKKRKANGPVEL